MNWFEITSYTHSVYNTFTLLIYYTYGDKYSGGHVYSLYFIVLFNMEDLLKQWNLDACLKVLNGMYL